MVDGNWEYYFMKVEKFIILIYICCKWRLDFFYFLKKLNNFSLFNSKCLYVYFKFLMVWCFYKYVVFVFFLFVYLVVIDGVVNCIIIIVVLNKYNKN